MAAIAFSVKPLPFDPTKQQRTEFVALGKAEGGRCGWVLLTWVPRDKRPPTLGLPTTRRPPASGEPVLALDMYEIPITWITAPKAGD